MTCHQSSGGDVFKVEDCKEFESMENLPELIDNDLAYSSNFEQWDTYWEDLTKYTRLTSCDIWGTKEVDFLGLDDFSSPYQDEEVISRTPTLAQLNSEDSQPVCDNLYLPDSLAGQKQTVFPPQVVSKKMGRTTVSVTGTSSSHSTLPDYAEGSQKATWPVASSTETMAKAQMQGPSRVASPQPENTDYVRKAKVRISVPRKPFLEGCAQQITVSASSPLIKEHESSASLISNVQAATIDTPSSLIPMVCEKRVEICKREAPCGSTPEVGLLRGKSPKLNFPVAGSSETLLTVSTLGADANAAAEKKKEEEHNYSLFLTKARLAGKAPTDMEEDEDEEEDDGEEEEEEEAEGVELDDEDHDEGFGSEHELSENEEEEEEEEDDDYEGDKDDDISDAFSEPGTNQHVYART